MQLNLNRLSIHQSDPAYIAQRTFGITDWREIGAMIAERAKQRLALLEEQKDWGRIQDAAQESWE